MVITEIGTKEGECFLPSTITLSIFMDGITILYMSSSVLRDCQLFFAVIVIGIEKSDFSPYYRSLIPIQQYGSRRNSN